MRWHGPAGSLLATAYFAHDMVSTASSVAGAARMRILVGVKRVIDYAVKVRVAADKKGMCHKQALAFTLAACVDD